MRRILALLTALALLLACAVSLADDDEGKTVYVSDFSAGADGWYGRGASVAPAGGVLKTTGRQDSWNSPGRDFALVPGGYYELGVEVLQEQLDSASFMISVAHTVNGATSYENLARGTAKKGEWTALKGTYTAGDYDTFTLYVETVGAGTLSFSIRGFTVTAPNGEPEPRPTEPPMVISAVDSMPALKDVYTGKFDFGSCVNMMQAVNPALMDFVGSQFNIVTPENELKPDAVFDLAASRELVKEDETAVAVHFDRAKPLLDWAQANGVKVHGHTLVWHSQTSPEFFREGYRGSGKYVTREVMLGRLENYIKGIMEYLEEKYPGVVVSWDVVNEAVDDGPGNLRGSPWLTVIGDDYLHRAFELARKYAPEGTKLYYNDYNTASPNKLNGIYRLLSSLLQEGNIDGYGFQMHHAVGQPTVQQIAAAVEKIASLGISLRVSELDVTCGKPTEAAFTAQAAFYAEVMKLILRYADQFEAVQVWGITDDASWRSYAYPLLFDKNRNPKPAFWAVADPDSIK